MIGFNCDRCGKLLAVRDDLAGKKTRCPDCKTVMSAPGSAEDSLARKGAHPSKNPAEDTEDPEIIRMQPDDDDQSRRKKTRSKKRTPEKLDYEFDKGGDPNPFAGFFTRRRLIGILLILWGLAVVIYGFTTKPSGGAYGAGQTIGAIAGVFILLAGVFYVIRGE